MLGGEARIHAVAEITPDPKLVPSRGHDSIVLGLIGQGISASLTPQLHEREAAANGLTCAYKIIDIAKLGLAPDDLPDPFACRGAHGFSPV